MVHKGLKQLIFANEISSACKGLRIRGTMSKSYRGVRLQRLREERGMTQVALAKALGICASYLNQIERNQRPLTVPILPWRNCEPSSQVHPQFRAPSSNYIGASELPMSGRKAFSGTLV
jgi:DNA-binding XRE family transcriptional regulator